MPIDELLRKLRHVALAIPSDEGFIEHEGILLPLNVCSISAEVLEQLVQLIREYENDHGVTILTEESLTDLLPKLPHQQTEPYPKILEPDVAALLWRVILKDR